MFYTNDDDDEQRNAFEIILFGFKSRPSHRMNGIKMEIK